MIQIQSYQSLQAFLVLLKLDLAFNNVKPKDWYFVLYKVQFRTALGYVRPTNQSFWLDGSRASFLVPSYSPSKS